MKKYLSILLCAVLLVSTLLAGCSTNLSYKFEVSLDSLGDGFDKQVFAESIRTSTKIDTETYIFSYDEKTNVVTFDFTEIAKAFYSSTYKTDKDVQSRFEGFAKSFINCLSNDVSTVYTDEEYGFQLDAPESGEEIAIMHTNHGDIYIRFFPEAAPKAVENFKTHAKNGYYNGLTFHRVIKDFMIQGGDPKGDGTGGESIWGEAFEDEFDQKLLNLRGSLVMANSGVNTNGSQFFINQNSKFGGVSNYCVAELFMYNIYGYESYISYYTDFETYFPTLDSFLSSGYSQGLSPLSHLIPDEALEIYREVGGNIHLDGAWRASGGHTVFGQVFKGIEVVDAIADVETNSSNNKPKQDVIISSIDILTYSAN